MSARTETTFFWLAVVALIGFGFVLGALTVRLSREPSPCHEDEALIWTDAPNRASCIPLDALGVRRAF